MPVTVIILVLLTIAVLIAITPGESPDLLVPVPSRFARWRQERLSREQTDLDRTMNWIERAKDPDKVPVGVDRHGDAVEAAIPIPRQQPPWNAAEPPSYQAKSMLPAAGFLLAPVHIQPPSAEREQVWAAQEREELVHPQIRPYEPGSEDPPTIVGGLRAILDDDLGGYLDELPKYEDQ